MYDTGVNIKWLGKDESRLNAPEMRSLKSMCSKTIYDRYQNEFWYNVVFFRFAPLTNEITPEDLANELIWLRFDISNNDDRLKSSENVIINIYLRNWNLKIIYESFTENIIS